jgi:hypothetical protein
MKMNAFGTKPTSDNPLTMNQRKPRITAKIVNNLYGLKANFNESVISCFFDFMSEKNVKNIKNGTKRFTSKSNDGNLELTRTGIGNKNISTINSLASPDGQISINHKNSPMKTAQRMFGMNDEKSETIIEKLKAK